MSEGLGEGLVRAGGAGHDPAEAQRLAARLLQRDRRRVRLLAAAAVFCWLVAVAGLVFLLVTYLKAVEPRLGAYASGRRPFEGDAEMWLVIGRKVAYILLGSAGAAALAALCTVWLVLTSRRATLRQISASLAEISTQLRQLRPTAGP